jgi:transposase
VFKAIVFVKIDLAKSTFALNGVDELGKVVLVRPAVRRDQPTELSAKIPPFIRVTDGSALVV